MPEKKGEDWSAQLRGFEKRLRLEERSPATVEKYLRDAAAFVRFAAGRTPSKELALAYKESLQERGYALRSVNSMLAGVNRFLRHLGREDCRVRSLSAQREIYCREERELSRAEYIRLLAAAEGSPRLHLLLQTICATGIRVSELRFFTLEAAQAGEVRVRAKGKSRTVLLPGKLKKALLAYAKKQGIHEGVIFRTRSGRPLDRSNIWSMMKCLCSAADVDPRKVFPHNLRKLFARTFYRQSKDIAKLADLLGHSSINTTRIYIISSGREHRRELERITKRLIA